VFDDPRLEVKIGDGFEYVKSATERFDLIVLDLTDPDTPAFHLYSEEFFRMCQRILKPGGMLTLHLGSPVYQADTVRKNAANLRKVFRHVAPMSLFIPLYGSLWCLAVASDSIDPRSLSTETLSQRMTDRRIDGLRYYYPGLHQALFTLPLFVQEMTQPPSSAAGSAPRLPQLRAA
jgi:spermidine synthase